MKLVLVESPTKSRTIEKFLSKEYKVLASYGHVRDLPQTAAEIPAKYKSQEWAKLGVNVEKDFEPLYVVPKGKAKVIKKLKQELKKADELYLATDEDREGESISWHLVQLLEPEVPIKRMVFHEITKSAIEGALKNPRRIDEKLVQAQEARRILDRLVGYTLSPLLWKKIAYGLSAGRVQSAGLRMIVERERQRLKFKSAEYWDILAHLNKDSQEFEARLTEVEDKKVVTGKDFNRKGELINKKAVVLNKSAAEELKEQLEKSTWTVKDKQEKEFASNPSPPYITSTLQQDGNRKLGLSARETMRIAQRLYENGFITYMRTDSPALSGQAIQSARSVAEERYGKDYLFERARNYAAKAKGAQEAHEAIRPAHREFIHPSDTGLSGKDLALYDLIWKRTIACQMKPAKKSTMTVEIKAENTIFTATGTRIVFPGFLAVYIDKDSATQAGPLTQETILPELEKDDKVGAKKLTAEPHETKPPARYNEASLVQRLEKEGIGRPSTYATIISTLLDREYVKKSGKALVPTFTAFAVIELLEKHFKNLVDYEFTSDMEESLDEIAAGKKEHLPYLKSFYLGDGGLRKQVQEREADIDPEESRTVELPTLKEKPIKLKVGRFGPYLEKQGQEKVSASVPEDLAPDEMTPETASELLEVSEKGPEAIGQHPETGEPVYVLVGRYGPYVQLGEQELGKKKPKRASLPKGVSPKDATLDLAVKLLNLPRTLGKHPETGKNIQANIGRYGPYVVHDGDFRSLKKEDDVYEIDLDRALELLAEEKKGRKKSKAIKELGKHPKDKKKIAVYDGRYGPYIKYGKKNISLPKDADPEKLTLDEAVKLIDTKNTSTR